MFRSGVRELQCHEARKQLFVDSPMNNEHYTAMVCATVGAFEYSECTVLIRWGAYHFALPMRKNLKQALLDNGAARAQKF
jgi:hypothetical protein